MIHNPKSNANSSGFLPEEREWMENFINSGFIDTFRHKNKEPHNYTWWRLPCVNSRAKNLKAGVLITSWSRNRPGNQHIKRVAILPERQGIRIIAPVLLEVMDI